MAEARAEEEEDESMRETSEQVVRRQPRPSSSGDRPNRRKPEHRHSQGPLSSIRAAIKRTSTRSTSLSETPRDRDRRRPEITILSVEPLASTSWFPGASGGFPPPPPPAAQIWGPTIPPSIQPPPSYEEVIREKTQEQVLLPPSSSSLSSSSSRRSVSTTTIATQTDAGSAPDAAASHVRPVKPPRPSFSLCPKPPHVDDITTAASQSAFDSIGQNTHSDADTDTHSTTHKQSKTHTQTCHLLSDLFLPLRSASGVQTDKWESSSASVTVAAPSTFSPDIPLERPRPRPRSKPSLQPIRSEVKVQTLVKLREDGWATLFARGGSDITNQEVSQGKYLQELLDAFSSDDWGFPDHRSDSSGLSQSEGEEEEEVEQEEMGTLKARIQAFEQQRIQLADGGHVDGNHGDGGNTGEVVAAKKPEPRPRPRLQGQPAKPGPPAVAPKPKNIAQPLKPSCKGFWEDGGLTSVAADLISVDAVRTTESLHSEVILKPQTQTEPSPSCNLNPAPGSTPKPQKTGEKPQISTSKPQAPIETPVTSFSVPVPAPRPLPSKHTSSLSLPQGDTSLPSHPTPPPRPSAAPRASLGAAAQDKSTMTGVSAPTHPPRPSSFVANSSGTQRCVNVKTPSSTAEPSASDSHASNVKPGSARPGLQPKPPALISVAGRAGQAPSLVSKPTGPSPPESERSLSRPPGPASSAKPPGPGPKPVPVPKPAPVPALALRRSPLPPSNIAKPNSSEPPLPPRPSAVKLLPLRPPPIKSIPGRPPPPAIYSTSSSTANHLAPSKTNPSPSVPVANQPLDPKIGPTPLPVTANQMQVQRVSKRGPPLPPRPKPGHPLYSYTTQEVLVAVDDPSPAPSEPLLNKGSPVVTPVIDPLQCLLDLDIQPEAHLDPISQSKQDSISQSESQSILPVQLPDQKQQSDKTPDSGPRCVARFDYEGEEEDELTFSQGDTIALLDLIGQDWGRGQIHGRVGIFPLNFTEIMEPLPQPTPLSGETTDDKSSSTVTTSEIQTTAHNSDQDQHSVVEEWAVALFDFPGQTAEDLSFQKGALIRVTEHIDTEWRRGRLEGREGLYPAAFTQPHNAQPISAQQSVVRGVAKALFDFRAESEDELTLKLGDIVTEVETVDEEWIMGVVGGKRGILPKNYISLL